MLFSPFLTRYKVTKILRITQAFCQLFSLNIVQFLASFVIPDANIMSGRAEGIPGYVQPALTRQQLVGMFAILEKFDEALELDRIFRADVSSLTYQMLGVTDTAHQMVHGLTTEPGVDDDGADGLSGWLQQHEATAVDVHDIRKRGEVIRVLLEVEKFADSKVRRKPYTAELFFRDVHGCFLSL